MLIFEIARDQSWCHVPKGFQTVLQDSIWRHKSVLLLIHTTVDFFHALHSIVSVSISVGRRRFIGR
jgi:hypothetical protein